jgi:hypothetical protein
MPFILVLLHSEFFVPTAPKLVLLTGNAELQPKVLSDRWGEKSVKAKDALWKNNIIFVRGVLATCVKFNYDCNYSFWKNKKKKKEK